jgi:excisionase family DNA binding protein
MNPWKKEVRPAQSTLADIDQGAATQSSAAPHGCPLALAACRGKQVDRAVLGESVDQLYTISKVAELLSVEEAFVTKLLAEGKLRQVKLDATKTRIPASSLKKYIAKLLK